MRGFLLYDGIHYDGLFLESLSGDSQKTLFSVEDEAYIYEMAESLAKEAKSSRQYTDVDKFTLKCLQCDTQLKVSLEFNQTSVKIIKHRLNSRARMELPYMQKKPVTLSSARCEQHTTHKQQFSVWLFTRLSFM